MGDPSASDRQADIDADLRATLDRVRHAENEVGNALGVVLAWLRMQADRPGALDGGLQVAIRRLEESQASVASLMHDVAAAAVRRCARDPLPVTDLFPDLAGHEARHQVVLANRTHLLRFVEQLGPALAADPVVTDHALLLPVLEPGRLGTEDLASLQASGGELVMHGPGPAASWPLSTGGVD